MAHSATAERGTYWCALAAAGVDQHTFGDQLVVFVRATADTHALSPAASAVLMTMLETPGAEHCADAWFALTFPDSECPQDAVERADFAVLLAELERIGVVVRLSP